MDRDAFDRAHESFARAKQALNTLRSQPLTGIFTPAFSPGTNWSDILIHGNRVFTRLEQGAKNTSKGWFDRKKHLRKNDQILAYMLHARNVDEHGIRRVYNVEEMTGNIVIPEGMQPGTPIINFVRDESGSIIDYRAASPGVRIESKGGYDIKLVTVKDRSVDYPPPTDVDGVQFNEHELLAVGQAFLDRLDTILKEAEELI